MRTRFSLLDTPSPNLQLEANLDNAIAHYFQKRALTLAEIPEYQDLVQRARKIRLDTLNGLPSHLKRFRGVLEGAGVRVIEAKSAEEARRAVFDIAKRHDVKRAVKSKSMLSEEVCLNEFLEESGIEVVETDLGELIVQLAKEKPSHILTPCIHKSQREIAELFSRVFQRDVPDEESAIAELARVFLREKFFSADMGITGVNFGVAETGTLAFVENEGNLRYCALLPRVHVALMGIERIAPDMESLGTLLTVLTLAGTGQRAGAYTTLLSPPEFGRKAPEQDRFFYLILVDNGRSGLLSDPKRRETLACIRCGACLNACVVYRHIGGHAYQAPYMGPIGAILMPGIHPKGTERLGFFSTLCGACREICPVGIDIPGQLLAVREQFFHHAARSPAKGVRYLAFLLASLIGRHPRVVSLARRLVRPMLAIPYIEHVLGWGKARDLPVPASRSFQERFWGDPTDAA
jgi:L-lactate dehydrogenase complex protein LldF